MHTQPFSTFANYVDIYSSVGLSFFPNCTSLMSTLAEQDVSWSHTNCDSVVIYSHADCISDLSLWLMCVLLNEWMQTEMISYESWH